MSETERIVKWVCPLTRGESLASGASHVRGYFVMFAHLVPPQRATDPLTRPAPAEERRQRTTLSPKGERADDSYVCRLGLVLRFLASVPKQLQGFFGPQRTGASE
jgi:hypothetical protein